MSLDGYIEDEDGGFAWSAPDEEVHSFVNELQRSVGTHLYGRKMYETMVYWETVETSDEPECVEEFAQLWRAADKVVFSSTLETVSSARTSLERHFDPESIRKLKGSVDHHLTVSGPNLAAHALRAGLVDECQFFLMPVTVGGGKHALPADVHLHLELLDERSFRNGVVYLHYRIARTGAPLR